jgi:mannose-6-phosphate isomerase-like protein (cupin superfamily)
MTTQVRSYVAGMLTGLGVAALGVAATTTTGMALQAPKPSVPQKYDTKIVLENERVRVKDVTFLPGVKDPGMHTHDLAHVGVVIQGGTLVFRYPDGKTETMKLDTGGAGYRGPNVSHEAINPGTTPVRVIEVELK